MQLPRRSKNFQRETKLLSKNTQLIQVVDILST